MSITVNRYAALLGTTPAGSLEDVLASLTRLRRQLDVDAEEAQSRGHTANLVTFTQLELLDALRDYIRPGAEADTCSGIVCIHGDCLRHAWAGEMYCGEHGGLPEYVTDPGYEDPAREAAEDRVDAIAKDDLVAWDPLDR